MKILASVTALGLVACVDQPQLGTTALVSFEEFRAAAALHREPGTNAYIVDGDIVLHDDQQLHDYWQRYQQGALTVYTLSGADVIWDLTQRLNLTYCIGSTFGANKGVIVNAMQQAADGGWMKFANVKFIHKPEQDANCTAANGNVMFDVNQVDANGQFLARAFFPNAMRAERNVLVDPSSFSTIWPLANILAHELGHVLGFRHEHVRAPTDPCHEDNNFRGVTAYDSASVMHYPQCDGTGTDLSFTLLDKQGAEMVYDKPEAPNLPPMAMINRPKDGDTVFSTFRVETTLIDQDLVSVSLLIDGELFRTLPLGGPYDFHVVNADQGPHQLVIKAVDSANQVTTQTINVVVMDPEPEPEPEDEGLCSTGSPSSFGLLLAAGLLALTRRTKRSRR